MSCAFSVHMRTRVIEFVSYYYALNANRNNLLLCGREKERERDILFRFNCEILVVAAITRAISYRIVTSYSHNLLR